MTTIPMWSSRQGAGEPVALLHGGFTDSRQFEGNLAGLADELEVLRCDRRGHGRTADAEGPISHHLMAADVMAWLAAEGRPVRLVGYSDGAVAALLVALQRPDLVERLVLISGVHDMAGWLVTPGADAADEMPAEMVDAYAEVSPDGREHLAVVAAKLAAASTEDLGITAEDLAGLERRTLLVRADDDLIALEHTLALYRALPRAELAVVPGTSHALLEEKPEEVTALVRRFLTSDPVQTLIPFRADRGGA